MKTPTINRQSGVTLVELLVAMVLSLILGAAVVTTFTNNSRSFNQDESILHMQDDARQALNEIAFDISMAGNYAELLLPSAVVPDGSLTLGTDCGPGLPNWMLLTRNALTGDNFSIWALDNATAGAASARHSCIAGSEFEDGTDVVAVKRVAGGRVATPLAGRTYLRTNGTVGLLYKAPFPVAPAIPVVAPSSDWEFRSNVYYIRNFANTAGDGIPTLCKKALQGSPPSSGTECLATGIEDLQIEYGIDTTDNGNPNIYLPNPTLAQLQTVVAARITLLARTIDPDTLYDNDKTYSLSNAPDYTPADNFHRRVFSTTVGIQNIRSLNDMGF